MAGVIRHVRGVAMADALRDHQTIDAISCEVFHVTIEQARAFAVQHAVAITNDRADGRARSTQRDFSNSSWRRSQIRSRTCSRFTRTELIRVRELIYGN